MTTLRLLFPLLLCGTALPLAVSAEQPKVPAASAGPSAPATPVTPAAESPRLAPLTLTQQFSGPLQNTAIQRFVDPETGVVCYLYTPYNVPNSRNEKGQVIYGANNIGSISCVAPWKK